MRLNNFKKLVLVLAFCVFAPNSAAGELNVLFVGNSYVSAHDLPDVLRRMLEAAGRPARVEIIANPGWTLSQHAASQATLKKIYSHRWDYVILQEQSVLPIIPSKQRLMVHAVTELERMNKGKTLMLMTWARRDGLNRVGMRDFEQMQEKLIISYHEVSSKVKVGIIPAGIAWKVARQEEPSFPLWERDGSHPSRAGTYLNACVIYGVITLESPVGNAHDPYLDEGHKEFIQEVAAATVRAYL